MRAASASLRVRAASSTSARNCASVFSRMPGKAPMRDLSGGIGVFFSHVPLTARKKSSCARTDGSKLARSIPEPSAGARPPTAAHAASASAPASTTPAQASARRTIARSARPHRYQIETRRSGGRYIRSPGLTPKVE